MTTALIHLSGNLVTIGNVFSTEKSYLYKQPVQYTALANYAFTKTFKNDGLLLFQETETGIKINNYSDIARRESLPPGIPTKGPFIENYSVNGLLDTNSFINLLLIDKPPVKTGFFKFYINDISFTGFITRQTKYTQYVWEKVGSKYTYVQKNEDLGYGIEISKNLLYTAEYVNGSYVYTPTALNILLNNLQGGEEIRSTVSDVSPNSYLNSIPGEPQNTNNSLPLNLFYISPADALRYIASYSDLIELFGTDYTKGQLHYATEKGSRSISFDPIAYLNKYEDLRNTYGYDTYAATIHYITTGYAQGRSSVGGSTTNPLGGGLYDERSGSVSVDNSTIIWPLGKTMENTGSSLTYSYNGTKFFITTSIPVSGNILYMGIQ